MKEKQPPPSRLQDRHRKSENGLVVNVYRFWETYCPAWHTLAIETELTVLSLSDSLKYGYVIYNRSTTCKNSRDTVAQNENPELELPVPKLFFSCFSNSSVPVPVPVQSLRLESVVVFSEWRSLAVALCHQEHVGTSAAAAACSERLQRLAELETVAL